MSVTRKAQIPVFVVLIPLLITLAITLITVRDQSREMSHTGSVVGHDAAAKVEIMPEDTGGVDIRLDDGGIRGVVDAWLVVLQALAERRGLIRDENAPLREEVRGRLRGHPCR